MLMKLVMITRQWRKLRHMQTSGQGILGDRSELKAQDNIMWH